MGRSCLELLSLAREPLPAGFDLLLVETKLRLKDGEFDPPGTHAAGLVSFSCNPTERARIRALAASFLTGKAQTHVLAARSWGQGLSDALSRTDAVEVNLVFALQTGQRPDFSALPADGRQSGIRLAVTDDHEVTQLNGFDGVIHVRRSVGEVAAAVFKMLAGLLAPETYFCLDTLDLLKPFEGGRPAEMAEAVWVAPGRLAFRDAADQDLLENCRCAAVFLSSACLQESRKGKRIIEAVMRHMPATSPLLRHECTGLFAPSWPSNGALSVSILCSR